ncbi:response regulator [Methanobacterium alcaliphilum]|uniref:response regulator n=1 Tax=Methanobacterium alcaliphilum TaxID=392018 RepID=UPI00200A43B1|nr:response regulator [Methanobacterium alcaliphilum]MCK9150790.1 response regulator [Methanobacterium alcaliphilum]
MSNPRVLIVEDEAITAMELTRRLKSWGYDVVGDVFSGEQALEMVRKCSIDLIIMDVYLNGPMDGVDAAKEILKTIEMPIVFLTAHGNIDSRLDGKSTHPFYYIIKPFRETELKFALDTAIGNHKLINELKSSKKFFEEVTSNIPGIIYQNHIQNNWHTDFINPDCLEKITGYTVDELKSNGISTIGNIILKEDRKMVLREISDSIATGESFQLTYHIQDKEGNIKIVMDTGKPVYNQSGDVRTIEGVIFESKKSCKI